MIKGIIFDCDGVIVDSEPLFIKAFRMQMDRYGMDVPDIDPMETAGTRMEEVAALVLKKYPQIDRTHEEYLKDQDECIEKVLMGDDLIPMKGFVEFVKKQHSLGRRMAVASGSPRNYVEHKLKLFQVDGYFDTIVSGDDVTRSKPDPETYALAADRLGFERNEMIAIEDAYLGVKSAKAAGLYVVGFKGGTVKGDTSEADEEVEEFEDIAILKESSQL